MKSKFGIALVAARQIHNMSQAELAEVAGIATSTISSYENGKMPNLNTAILICKTLRISLDRLYDIKELENADEFVTICNLMQKMYGTEGDC